MKKCFLLAGLLVGCLNLQASGTKAIIPAIGNIQKTLTDGWYYAEVAYYNYATYLSADYTLKVKVKDGMVIIIYLNNGGILHWGINNEGYLYTGGKLDVKEDKKSQKLQYTTQVSISNGRSISSYSISILKEVADGGGDEGNR
jgi:hypothetical protein